MKDSGDLEGAGVLLRQIDKNNDEEHPWLPCPIGSWCSNLRDRWPASIVNPDVPHLYEPMTGGMILAPTV